MLGYKEYYKALEEKAKQMSDVQFDKYYKKLLKSFGAKDIEDLSKENKKKFFNQIDKDVKSDSGE